MIHPRPEDVEALLQFIFYASLVLFFLGLGGLGYLIDHRDAKHGCAWLVPVSFAVSGLPFVMWATSARSILPLLGMLFLPTIFGLIISFSLNIMPPDWRVRDDRE